MGDADQALLARSTQTASFLIALQIGSRGLTFAVNQLLLRSLDSSLLGLSNQLDLFVVTVLTFSRESIRISLGRQDDDGRVTEAQNSHNNGKSQEGTNISPEVKIDKSKLTGSSLNEIRLVKIQEAINIAYLSPAIGPFLSFFLGYVYYTYASETVRNSPHIVLSISAYGAAAAIELLAEPCFAIAAREGYYTVRAQAETTATIARCVTTYAAMTWNIRSQKNLGTLPFALGQLCYSCSLTVIYWANMLIKTRQELYVPWPRSPDKVRAPASRKNLERYAWSFWAKPVLVLAATLYGQSILKHFLTQGDSFMVSIFTSLEHQGVYTLASNYGSLLARMLFQPIEESSRGVFSSLLGAATTTSDSRLRSSPERVSAAKTYLVTIARLYALLTVVIVSCGPVMASPLLHFVAGKRWVNTEAGHALGLYCYYIPLLAFNGIFEAFVAATATPAQLRTQSEWMAVFSVLFAGISFLFLWILGLGAKGLIFANAINMAIRIVWSWQFMTSFFKGQNTRLSAKMCMPRFEIIFAALTTKLCLDWLIRQADGDVWDIAGVISIIGVLGVTFTRHHELYATTPKRPFFDSQGRLFLERTFLSASFGLLRSKSRRNVAVNSKKKV